MVFAQLSLGFVTGITIVMNSHEYIYMTISGSFVRPHWRYWKLRSENYCKNTHAHDLTLLDSYLKDTVSSFFLFFVLIGPACYRAYYDKLEDEDVSTYEDSYATMLNKIN